MSKMQGMYIFFSFCKYTFTNEQEQSCVSKLMFDVVNEISRVMFV